ITIEAGGEYNTYYAEPVILDPRIELLAGGKRDRPRRFNNRGALCLRVFGAAVSEAGWLRRRFRAENAPQAFHFDRFGNVVEAEDAEVALTNHGRDACPSRQKRQKNSGP